MCVCVLPGFCCFPPLVIVPELGVVNVVYKDDQYIFCLFMPHYVFSHLKIIKLLETLQRPTAGQHFCVCPNLRGGSL